jgi:outer membrane lipoprotein SlyB
MSTLPTLFQRFLTLLFAISLAACATTNVAPFSGTGNVLTIREIKEPSTFATAAGAIGGAAVGGVIGANVGGGSGQIAAASVLSVVTGTLGVAAARWLGSSTRYEVLVRFEDGIDRSYSIDQAPSFRPGASVRIEDGKLVPGTR